MADAVVLLGCGDVGPIHEPMDRYSELVRRALLAESADITRLLPASSTQRAHDQV
jgi:hypothetical protein